MLSRRVDLPSGGYLMIDYAEALTVIDVNTGSFTGKGKQARLEDTITKTNLEAAEEVVNQLRLRDIGGIIVIDFIDMARARNRDAVLKTLRKALDEDRTKTFVVEISPLGLVEMTRQNVTDGVREIMTKHCPTCGGEGVVKSEETIAIEVERRLRELVQEAGDGGPEAYLVRLNPKVTHYFTADSARTLHALEQETGHYFHFTGSEGLPLDHFAIVAEGTREEITEQAVPFRAGEEVHVDIVEPHMFNDDDAVAKVDGYLIEVVNGVPYVGEKRLVRIEEAGRTAARAVLTGTEAEEAAAAAEERAQARLRQERSRKGAATRARRKEEAEAAAKPAPRRRSRKKADEDGKAEQEEAVEAVEALTEDGAPEAGTGPAALSDAEGGETGDGNGAVESRPRRRGRRGGRRRSRAKAGADAPDTSDVSE
jgi:ribonuclease G